MKGGLRLKMNIEKSMRVGKDIVEQVWERTKPNELARLKEGPRERILVIKGSYDHIEKILSDAKIPHTKLDGFPNEKDFLQGEMYQHSKVIFVNCDSNYHGYLGGKNLSSKIVA